MSVVVQRENIGSTKYNSIDHLYLQPKIGGFSLTKLDNNA